MNLCVDLYAFWSSWSFISIDQGPESLHVEREREMCSDQLGQTDRACKDWSFNLFMWSLHTFGNKASNTFEYLIATAHQKHMAGMVRSSSPQVPIGKIL
jgi:hypothetical protein